MGKQYTRAILRPPTQVLAAAPHDRDKEFGSVNLRAKPQAALRLGREMPHSVTAVQRQQLVLQLQRQLGNRNVARFLEAQRNTVPSRATHRERLITRQMDEPSQEQVAVDPVPPVSITGEPHEVVAYAGAPNIRCEESRAPSSMAASPEQKTW